jgi:hypothetical protein
MQMNRLSVLFLCLSICGCGSVSPLGNKSIANTAPAPISAFQKDLARSTYVEFMGDDQIQGVVNYVNNPMWKCSTCVPEQLSADVLKEVPDVIARKPDMVMILTGAYDLKLPGADDRAQIPAGNVEQIVALFQAAKIPAVVWLLPELSYTDVYYFDTGMTFLNEDMPPEVPYLFYPTDYGPMTLTPDFDFTPYALAQIEPNLYLKVQSFGLGGIK